MEVELLKPCQLSQLIPQFLPGIGFGRPVSSQLPEIVEEEGGCEKVYVAVGKSVDKGVDLLQWSFKHFANREICVLHVHQPSLLIPYPLGKLPVSQANGEVLMAHRRMEKEQTKKLLQYYLTICHRAKVEASIVTIECDQVHKGIVELVHKHGARKLVMAAIPKTCVKVKKSSNKADFVARSVPFFCEIWFINKGKHVWTREASERSSHAEVATAEISRSRSFRYRKTTIASLHPEYPRSNSTAGITCARVSNWVQGDSNCAEADTSDGHFTRSIRSAFSSTSSRSSTNPTEARMSPESDSKVEEESLCCQFEEVRKEAEASRNEALEELLRRKKLEFQTLESISKVKIFESAYANEVKLKKQAEDALRNTIQEQGKLLEEKEEISNELQRTMRSIALLDSRVQEADRRKYEASGELKLVQTSIASLKQEKQRIQQQKMEAVRWLERWRNHGQAGSPNCNGFLGFVEELPELAEFSLSDLKTATCNFSESFKLGHGGYGCVFKGEMLGRTVAIKKLHPYNMQGQSEFQKRFKF